MSWIVGEYRQKLKQENARRSVCWPLPNMASLRGMILFDAFEPIPPPPGAPLAGNAFAVDS